MWDRTPSALEPTIPWGSKVQFTCVPGETVRLTVSKTTEFEMSGKRYVRQPDNTFKSFKAKRRRSGSR